MVKIQLKIYIFHSNFLSVFLNIITKCGLESIYVNCIGSQILSYVKMEVTVCRYLLAKVCKLYFIDHHLSMLISFSSLCMPTYHYRYLVIKYFNFCKRYFLFLTKGDYCEKLLYLHCPTTLKLCSRDYVINKKI